MARPGARFRDRTTAMVVRLEPQSQSSREVYPPDVQGDIVSIAGGERGRSLREADECADPDVG